MGNPYAVLRLVGADVNVVHSLALQVFGCLQVDRTSMHAHSLRLRATLRMLIPEKESLFTERIPDTVRPASYFCWLDNSRAAGFQRGAPPCHITAMTRRRALPDSGAINRHLWHDATLGAKRSHSSGYGEHLQRRAGVFWRDERA